MIPTDSCHQCDVQVILYSDTGLMLQKDYEWKLFFSWVEYFGPINHSHIHAYTHRWSVFHCQSQNRQIVLRTHEYAYIPKKRSGVQGQWASRILHSTLVATVPLNVVQYITFVMCLLGYMWTNTGLDKDVCAVEKVNFGSELKMKYCKPEDVYFLCLRITRQENERPRALYRAQEYHCNLALFFFTWKVHKLI